MSDTQQSKSLPVYRIGFAPYDGTDKAGNKVIGYPIEIGSCWNRKDTSKGLVAKLRVIPANLQDGVILLLPPQDERNGDAGEIL